MLLVNFAKKCLGWPVVGVVTHCKASNILKPLLLFLSIIVMLKMNRAIRLNTQLHPEELQDERNPGYQECEFIYTSTNSNNCTCDAMMDDLLCNEDLLCISVFITQL